MSSTNIYCPHCGFANSYAYSKPSKCRKCNKSLSFNSTNFQSKEVTSAISSELTAAECRFIINNFENKPINQIVKLMWGDEIETTDREYILVQDFINSLNAKKMIGRRPSRISENYDAKEDSYEDGDQTPNGNLPNISELSFTVEDQDSNKPMTLESAVFLNPVSPDATPKINKRKINSKKQFSTIKEKYFPKAERATSVDIFSSQ